MSIFDQFIAKGAAANKETRRKHQVTKLIMQLDENEKEDCEQFPEDGERWTPFLLVLKNTLEQYRERDPEEPVDAAVCFYITKDRMHAYACMLPPLSGGKDLPLDEFGKGLQRSGITTGINEELTLTILAERKYLHLFPIAEGTPPQDGKDGWREDLFEPRPVFMIEQREKSQLDFSNQRPVQLIRRGETVSHIHPSVPGKEGVDVTGHKLPCRHGKPAEIQMGINMELSEDGTRLEATANGAVFVNDKGDLYVQTAIVRRGNLKADDDFVWMAYIDGDVPEGVKVVATSNILVMGEVRGAEIQTKGCLRVQKGIRAGSSIEARGQVLAPVIESSRVKAGRDIFAEEIRDSDILCRGSLYVTGGKGLIHGGTVRAVEQVVCTQVGSPSGGRTQFLLGYSPELKEELNRLSAEWEETQAMVEKLWKNIHSLRKGGGTLSLEKRKLLSQLVEQKTLYEEHAAELGAQLRKAQDQRRVNGSGQIVCQKMYPVTAVRIGSRSNEFTLPESPCRIHLYAGQVVSK